MGRSRKYNKLTDPENRVIHVEDSDCLCRVAVQVRNRLRFRRKQKNIARKRLGNMLQVEATPGRDVDGGVRGIVESEWGLCRV